MQNTFLQNENQKSHSNNEQEQQGAKEHQVLGWSILTVAMPPDYDFRNIG
jgi:hypothetical protein